MGKLSVKRVNLNKDTITPIQFGTNCGQYLIKNYSNTPVYVSFDEDLKEEEAIKIESGMGQEVIGNYQYDWTNYFKTSTIYLKGEGEIEVQQLCFEKQ